MISRILISKEEIENRIKELAEKISIDFKYEELTIICVLKGAFIFASDLIRSIKIPKCNIEFISTTSYKDMESTGFVNIINLLRVDINNKNVLIVEDILDTGLTLKKLTEFLINSKPKSLKTCVLLNKKERRKVDFIADYVGFEIEDKFVIGYGLDYNENFRELPEIYYVVDHG
jgi:hypoxanthine phosphoribosyltransferase